MPTHHVTPSYLREIFVNQLKEQYDNVATMTYDIVELIDAIINIIDDLKTLLNL